MSDSLIVRDLVKRYGNVAALAGVSFSVAAGEICGLLGRNGAGKTTAVECVLGMRTPDGGTIEICGHDAIRQANTVKRLIGAQLQQTALQDKITPREALRLFAAFYGKTGNVTALLRDFQLEEKADAAFDTLSGGQRQRLALALAVVHEPAVVLLDEPSAGLDAQSRRQLHEMIRGLRERGRAILLTTHLIDEAEVLCDRVVVLDHGRVVAAGPTAELTGGGARKLEDVFIELTGAAPLE